MTKEDLIAGHNYIQTLDIDETTKETCRGIMFGRYWALQFKEHGLDITDVPTRELIDMIANAQVPPQPPQPTA